MFVTGHVTIVHVSSGSIFVESKQSYKKISCVSNFNCKCLLRWTVTGMCTTERIVLFRGTINVS